MSWSFSIDNVEKTKVTERVKEASKQHLESAQFEDIAGAAKWSEETAAQINAAASAGEALAKGVRENKVNITVAGRAPSADNEYDSIQVNVYGNPSS